MRVLLLVVLCGVGCERGAGDGGVVPVDNAAVLYREAFGLSPGEESVALQVSSALSGPLTDAMIEGVAGTEHVAVARLLREAEGLRCDWGLDLLTVEADALVSSLIRLRAVVRLQVARARIALETEDARFVHEGMSPAESAVVDVLGAWRLIRHAGSPNLMLTGLAASATEVRCTGFVAEQWGRLDDAARARLRAGMAVLPPAATLVGCLRGDRAVTPARVSGGLVALDEDLFGVDAATDFPGVDASDKAALAEAATAWLAPQYAPMIDVAARPMAEWESGWDALDAAAQVSGDLRMRLMVSRCRSLARFYVAASIRRAMVESMLGLGVVDPATGAAFERVEGEGVVTLRSGFEMREGEVVEMVFVLGEPGG